MDLTVAMVVRELLMQFPAGTEQVHAPDAPVSRPLFLAADETPESGRVYVCRPGTAVAVRSDALLILVAEPQMDANGNVLTFPPGTDADMLMNGLQRIFDRYARWDESLKSMLGQQPNLNELLDAAAAMLQNPLLLCTADYAVVARSSTIADDAGLSGSHVSGKLVNALALDKRFSEMDTRIRPYRYTERGSGTECLCVNLFAAGKPAYRMLAAATERPLQSGDEALLSRAAEYMRCMLFAGDHTFGRMAMFDRRTHRVEMLIKNAIGDGKTDAIPIMSGLQEIDWLPEHSYCFLSIHIGQRDYRTHTVELICNRLEELLHESCAFEHEGSVVMLINLTRFSGSADDAVGAIVYFLRDNFLKAGVSNAFAGFADLYDYYRQSRIALRFVTRPQAYRWIMRFSNIALDYMMEQCLHEMPLHVVCDPNILAMKRYDETHNTEFYRTLTSYVQNRFNAMATAKALFIHRSTFLYRIERIREMFNVDFDNDDALLYALLSCKMLETGHSMLPMVQMGETES